MATRKNTTRRRPAAQSASHPARAGAKARGTAKAPPPKRARAVRAPAARTAAAASATAAPATLPDIEVELTGGRRLNLASLKGQNVVLYFYPKDDTPGCTAEGCDIRDHYAAFQRHDTMVLGVSRDSLASHERFKAKHGFPFELVSDADERLCRRFGVLREKSLYGRKTLGVERSTFLYDRQGRLRREWRGVKVDGHADEVLAELARLPPS